MPLMKGKSEKAFKKNVETEMHHGKPQKQALAIAYSTQRAARKRKRMADGGSVPEPDPQKAKEMQAGATESGWQPGKWAKNIKEGLGMAKGGIVGGQAPGETQQRHGGVKPGYGNLGVGSNTAPKSPKSPMITAEEAAKARAMLEHEHSRDCFAHGGEVCRYGFGGVVGAYAPGCEEGGDAHVSKPGYGSLGSGSDQAAKTPTDTDEDEDENARAMAMIKAEHEREALAYGGSVYDHIKRKKMAEGGVVGKNNDGDYDFDIQDEIEHPNSFYTRNEDVIPGEEMYHDDYGTDPEDSNEKGDKLEDADEHGKSMFRRIKMKKAQPGDRGKY